MITDVRIVKTRFGYKARLKYEYTAGFTHHLNTFITWWFTRKGVLKELNDKLFEHGIDETIEEWLEKP